MLVFSSSWPWSFGPGVYNLSLGRRLLFLRALRIGGSSPLLLLLPILGELLGIKDESRRARLSSVLGGWEAALCFTRGRGCCCVLISVPEVRIEESDSSSTSLLLLLFGQNGDAYFACLFSLNYCCRLRVFINSWFTSCFVKGKMDATFFLLFCFLSLGAVVTHKCIGFPLLPC